MDVNQRRADIVRSSASEPKHIIVHYGVQQYGKAISHQDVLALTIPLLYTALLCTVLLLRVLFYLRCTLCRILLLVMICFFLVIFFIPPFSVTVHVIRSSFFWV